MPNKDVFAALDLYKKNSEHTELNTGLVTSVGTLNAQVRVGRSPDTQRCSYNNDMVLQRGDTVLLVRTSGNTMCVIVSVIGRSNAGSSEASRATPNNAPGTPRNSTVTMGAMQATNSWGGLGDILMMQATMTFNGGSVALVANGSATPSSGGDITLLIGWGEVDVTYIFKATLKTTTPYTPINIFDVLPGALFGTHTFSVYGNINPTAGGFGITFTRFALLEI